MCVRVRVRVGKTGRETKGAPKFPSSLEEGLSARSLYDPRVVAGARLRGRCFRVTRTTPKKSVYVRAWLRGLTAVRVAGLLLVRATTNAEFCPWNIFERKGRTKERKEERKNDRRNDRKEARKRKKSKHFHETESLSVAPPSRPSIKIGGPKPRKVDSSIVPKRSKRCSFSLIFTPIHAISNFS